MDQEDFTSKADRELATTVRNLKSLAESVKYLTDTSLSSKDAIEILANTLRETKGEERKAEVDRLVLNRQRIEQEREIIKLMESGTISSKEMKLILAGLAEESKTGAKTFKEFTERLKDAKLNISEMGSLTADFFKLAKAGWAGIALSVAKFAFDADIMGKKASLIAGGPVMTGSIFTPKSEISSQMPGFFISMGMMGKSIDESIASLKKWNFLVRKEGSESGDSSNTKYIIDAARISTAMAKLSQVSENTANKLTETLMVRLNYSATDVDNTFQKLNATNRKGALTNEQYISSVTEMIEKNSRYNKNMDGAIPIIKDFDKAVKSGVFTMAEVITSFTAIADMPAERSAGLTTLIKQAGLPLSKDFAKAGNDPFAMAEAAFFSGASKTNTMSTLALFGQWADQQHRPEGTPGRLASMSKSAELMGLNWNPGQIEAMLKLAKTPGSTQADFDKVKTISVAENIGMQTKDLNELLGYVKVWGSGKALQTMIWAGDAVAGPAGDVLSNVTEHLTDQSKGLKEVTELPQSPRLEALKAEYKEKIRANANNGSQPDLIINNNFSVDGKPLYEASSRYRDGVEIERKVKRKQ